MIDVPEGLLSVGLHCRPGPPSPSIQAVNHIFAHTDDVRLTQAQVSSDLPPDLKVSKCQVSSLF